MIMENPGIKNKTVDNRVVILRRSCQRSEGGGNVVRRDFPEHASSTGIDLPKELRHFLLVLFITARPTERRTRCFQGKREKAAFKQFGTRTKMCEMCKMEGGGVTNNITPAHPCVSETAKGFERKTPSARARRGAGRTRTSEEKKNFTSLYLFYLFIQPTTLY